MCRPGGPAKCQISFRGLYMKFIPNRVARLDGSLVDACPSTVDVCQFLLRICVCIHFLQPGGLVVQCTAMYAYKVY